MVSTLEVSSMILLLVTASNLFGSVFSRLGTVNIYNSTIDANYAQRTGGAVFIYKGDNGESATVNAVLVVIKVIALTASVDDLGQGFTLTVKADRRVDPRRVVGADRAPGAQEPPLGARPRVAQRPGGLAHPGPELARGPREVPDAMRDDEVHALIAHGQALHRRGHEE